MTNKSKHQHWTDEDLLKVIGTSSSRAKALFSLLKDVNKIRQGYYYKCLREDIIRLDIDISHFVRADYQSYRSDDEIFQFGSKVDGSTLKKD